MEGESYSLPSLYLYVALDIGQSELKPFFPLLLKIETEAISWRCSAKKVFLKNSQNSQENNCARVSGPIFYVLVCTMCIIFIERKLLVKMLASSRFFFQKVN